MVNLGYIIIGYTIFAFITYFVGARKNDMELAATILGGPIIWVMPLFFWILTQYQKWRQSRTYYRVEYRRIPTPYDLFGTETLVETRYFPFGDDAFEQAEAIREQLGADIVTHVQEISRKEYKAAPRAEKQ